MPHRMTIRLIHVYQFEIPNLCYDVKCQSGVIWGHRSQKIIFTKNVTSVSEYMALSSLFSLRPSIVFMGPRLTWGHFRRQGTPAVPAFLSSSASSSFWQHFSVLYL